MVLLYIARIIILPGCQVDELPSRGPVVVCDEKHTAFMLLIGNWDHVFDGP